MSSTEHSARPSDKAAPPSPSDPGAANALHNAVFNSPDEYLTFMKNNYNALSRGDTDLSLHDVQIDSTDASLTPQQRAAAAITAAHYKELTSIAAQDGLSDSPVLGQYDFSRVQYWVDQNVLEATAARVVNDIAFGIGSIGTGLFAGGFVGASAPLLADGALATFGFVAAGVAMAAAGVGFGGFLFYDAATAYSSNVAKSAADKRHLTSWLKP